MEKEIKICKVPWIGDIMHSNFNICEEILDAFYALVPQPSKESQLDKPYAGPLNRRSYPFTNNVYGAYPLKHQWDALIYRMENHDKNEYFKDFVPEVVWQHLQRFALGFQHGYDNFVKDIVDNTPLSLSSDNIKTQTIIDYVTNPFGGFGFSERMGSGDHVFSNWYNDGVTAGHQYCAWFIILKNHKVFEPFFKQNKNN